MVLSHLHGPKALVKASHPDAVAVEYSAPEGKPHPWCIWTRRKGGEQLGSGYSESDAWIAATRTLSTVNGRFVTIPETK